MRFTETGVAGVFIIDVEAREDSRGLFARTFCAREFAAHGLETAVAQCYTSANHRRGTVRGLHYQVAPATETKVVRCTRGAVYDVVVDVRPDSPTYGAHVGVELSAESRRAVYVPALCAHGYQALTDGAEIVSQVGGFYAPECERGIRYDDPAFGVTWPLPVGPISDKDAAWPLVVRPAAGVRP